MKEQDAAHSSSNGTTIEQQIKAVEGEVKMYTSRMTWHDHQKALDDAVSSLKELTRLRSELQQKDEEIERIKRELVDARAKSDLLNTLLRSNIK